MRIKKLHIQNFKSLVDFKLENLHPFCAFVGPNASGKSNIFEAIEFSNYFFRYSFEAGYFFGGKKSIFSYNPKEIENYIFPNGGQSFFYEFNDGIIIDFFLSFTSDNDDEGRIASSGSKSHLLKNIEQLNITELRDLDKRSKFVKELEQNNITYDNDYEQFVDRFSRIFIGKPNLIRSYGSPPYNFYSNLSSDASNLSQTLAKIFEDEAKREDFIEWLPILIPEFSNLEVKKSSFDGLFDFVIYEKSSKKPFPKYLISDGTFNILSLMAAVFQNQQPQFLCIEEPENGLHPHAIELLVDFFREKCEQEGHTIWLNTHSPSLVRCLNFEEIVLVNKTNGETKAKQLSIEDNINIKTDEAWLSNALGGGVSWSK